MIGLKELAKPEIKTETLPKDLDLKVKAESIFKDYKVNEKTDTANPVFTKENCDKSRIEYLIPKEVAKEKIEPIILRSDFELKSTIAPDSDLKTEARYDVAERPGLTEEEKAKIKEETGWSDEIIENIKNMDQYKILKNAGLKEVEINGKKCLIKENIDLDYTDEDGISNRDRISRGLAPLDSKTGKPIELHHLGQRADSPLVELTEEEHRTGEYEDGKKNQSLWHDNTVETEVHGEGSNWDQERKAHWKARAEE